MTEIDRTSALGLYNTGNSFWRSATTLAQAKLKTTHPHMPVSFLYCHAAELYLKAFLKSSGETTEKLKGIGHNLARLAGRAVELGLKLTAETEEVLRHIQDHGVAMDARYIQTGFKQLPPDEAFEAVARELDAATFDALSSKGEPVRRSDFVAPTPPLDFSEDEAQILAYLFEYGENYDMRAFSRIAMHLAMNGGFVRHHLDTLGDADLVVLGGVTADDEYWGLTPSGRAYVVKNKLVSARDRRPRS